MPSPLETDDWKCLPAISATTSDKLKSIETFRVPPRWLLVKVETEMGIVGWGGATVEVL
ncbi:hypothetical protein V1506DRAFT_541683 [Lipomyces tetrasporus]